MKFVDRFVIGSCLAAVFMLGLFAPTPSAAPQNVKPGEIVLYWKTDKGPPTPAIITSVGPGDAVSLTVFESDGESYVKGVPYADFKPKRAVRWSRTNDYRE